MTDYSQSPIADVADAVLPDVLETLLQAEADFARLLREAAPLPEGSMKDFEYLELVTRYDRYVPSTEVTAIARLLYMLDAYGVTDEKASDELIALHNERMAELASDTAYLLRMRIQKSRLLEAQFSGPARLNVVSNFKVHGRVAIDAIASDPTSQQCREHQPESERSRPQVAESIDGEQWHRGAGRDHHCKRIWVSCRPGLRFGRVIEPVQENPLQDTDDGARECEGWRGHGCSVRQLEYVRIREVVSELAFRFYEINPDAGRSLAGPLHKVDPASAFSGRRDAIAPPRSIRLASSPSPGKAAATFPSSWSRLHKEHDKRLPA